VPFILSLVLFRLAIYIRSKLDETPEYVAAMEKASAKAKAEKVPVADLFRNSRRELLCGFFAMGGHQALSYVLNTFALSYMTNTVGMAKSDSPVVLIIALGFSLFCAPVGGMLADKYGSGNILAVGALIALALVWPLFHAIDSKDVVPATIPMSAVYGISWAARAARRALSCLTCFRRSTASRASRCAASCPARSSADRRPSSQRRSSPMRTASRLT
jgi:predicted MFS family arabinose efflux permease